MLSLLLNRVPDNFSSTREFIFPSIQNVLKEQQNLNLKQINIYETAAKLVKGVFKLL